MAGFLSSIASIWPFGNTRKVPPTAPAGSDGVQSLGGYIYEGEKSRDLQGISLWLYFSNVLANVATVAAGWRYFMNLTAGTDWDVEANDEAGSDGERACDLIRRGLFTADMPTPWGAVVKKQALYKGYGYSIHEGIIRRRSDGSIIYGSLEHRPQYTVRWWNKPDEQGPLLGVGQLTRQGSTYYLPMDRLWYIADNALGDGPEGVGMLRHVVSKVKQLERLEQLELYGFETDLRGIPVGRAPLGSIIAEANANAAGMNMTPQAYVDLRMKSMQRFLQKHVKTPELSIMLDSEPYTDPDGNISAIPKWALDMMKGDGAPLADVARAIDRKNREIARVLGVEFMMMGGSSGGGGSGSSAMHEDKTAQFASMIQSTLNEMAASARTQLGRRLIAFNGLNPDTCTPKFIPGVVSTESVALVCQALAQLALAGAPMSPNDPAINQIRGRMHIAEQPKNLDLQGVLPRAAPGKPAPTPDKEPPDPSNDDSIDVDVEDIGDQVSTGKAA